jgi:hypothetical protein
MPICVRSRIDEVAEVRGLAGKRRRADRVRLDIGQVPSATCDRGSSESQDESGSHSYRKRCGH